MDAVPALSTPAQLIAAGLAEPAAAPVLEEVAARYATAIPPTIQSLIQSDPDGVIARQFVPDAAELTIAPEERADPIGDSAHMPVPGLVHRYPDRVLLLPTHACAVYCRFCFRREVVGPAGGTLGPDELSQAFAYIRANPGIFEVILTGGDPLVLSPRRLSEIIARLNEIAHVQVLRIHTRVPIAAPERITEDIVAALKTARMAVYVGVHCNHARELSAGARAACARLADAGMALVSQSVLLRGVNDSVGALEELMRSLLAARIKPYYLHQLDLAPGTSRFRVPIEEGQAMVQALRGRLSGLAQPIYVLDIPGGAGKVPIAAPWLQRDETGALTVTDPNGGTHSYPA